MTLKQWQNVLWVFFVTNNACKRFFFGQHGISPAHLSHHALPHTRHSESGRAMDLLNTKIHRAPINYCRLTGLGGTELVGFRGAKRNTSAVEARKSAKTEEQREPEKCSKETLKYRAALKTHGGRWMAKTSARDGGRDSRQTGFCTRGTESSRNKRGGEAARETSVVKILHQEAEPRAPVALTPSPGTAA